MADLSRLAYSDRLTVSACLRFVHAQMAVPGGRLLGAGRLATVQWNALRALEALVDGERDLAMHAPCSFDNLDIAGLWARGGNRTTVAGHPVLPRPRVTLSTSISRNGDLSVRWTPAPGSETDWQPGIHLRCAETDGLCRPRNEVFSVQGMASLDPAWHRSCGDVDAAVIEETLVFGIEAALRAVRQRMSVGCDVETEGILALSFDPPSAPVYPLREWGAQSRHPGPGDLMAWGVMSVEGARRMAAGRWLSGFEAFYGMTLDTFLDVVRSSRIPSTHPDRNLALAKSSSEALSVLKDGLVPLAVKAVLDIAERDFPDVYLCHLGLAAD